MRKPAVAPHQARATRVAHTEKRPERCPYCDSTHVAKKGTRKKKIEVVQLWRCASCTRVFTPAPAPLRNKTYPLKVVLDAITTYDLGYTLDKTTERMRSRYGHRIGRSTIAAWLAEHRALTTYWRLRAEGRRLYPPTRTIRSLKLYHRQIYKFECHRPKLALLRESREHRRFAAVADFLERVPIECPHDLFRASERASQKAASFLDTRHLMIVEKENAATRMAGLVIPTVGDNRLRHEALQRFMLANDSTTLAVEIPIWLTPVDIAALEAAHGVVLLPEGSGAGNITGHIDFLQVRNGAVHILDYKPGARADKPVAQLMIYALALTRLAGLRLFDIKCAWFDQDEYCEFFPRTLLARRRGVDKAVALTKQHVAETSRPRAA